MVFSFCGLNFPNGANQNLTRSKDKKPFFLKFPLIKTDDLEFRIFLVGSKITHERGNFSLLYTSISISSHLFWNVSLS